MTDRMLKACALATLCAGGWADNLAREAAYTVTVSGFVYRGQVIPGTNTPATVDGFMDAPLWQQDSVEVFWQRPGSDAYAHVVVNAAGAVMDALAEGPRAEDPTWNADITAEVRSGQKSWSVRLAIPLEDDGLGRIPPGGQIRLEVARNRPGGGETTCWAPTGGMFKGATELWGVVRLQ